MTRPDIDDESTLIDEVIAEYISSEDAGASIDRETLMAQHPDLETDLRQFFRDRDRFRKAARPLSMATSHHQDHVSIVR
ncbi:MAG: hypothetical protein O3C17_23030 [Planctomycetota bacterium]|nr:hypothetical protein [Planctomycetota bacterium]